MSYLPSLIKLFSKRKKQLYPKKKNQTRKQTHFEDLNKLHEKDGIQFDAYGNPYFNDDLNIE